jgi:hypothetical protein
METIYVVLLVEENQLQRRTSVPKSLRNMEQNGLLPSRHAVLHGHERRPEPTCGFDELHRLQSNDES